MKQQDYYLQVYSSGSITVQMKKELIALDEVKVTAKRYDNVKGMQITTELPAYRISEVEINDSADSKNITDSEKKYKAGKMISSIEVLEIGNKQKTPGTAKCIITGKIVDISDSEPLIGATVYIDELKSGAVTDLEGGFRLALKPGKYKANFNYM